jgi:hypothetical protein
MTRQPARSLRIRLAFEPNRFSCEQLERVYEQLKPTERRVTSGSPLSEGAERRRSAAKRGER